MATPNNPFERSVSRRGPRLATTEASCPAAQPGRQAA